MSQVVIVTGSGRGLGRAVGERFGAAGAKVAVSYHTSAQGAEEAATAIARSGGEALVQRCDVTEYQQVEALVNTALARWGRVDVLVNNSGESFATWRDPSQKLLVHETTEEEWQFVTSIVLSGTFHGIKAVAPHMIKQRDGHIINIFSAAALVGRWGYGPASASRGGVLALTKTVARELGEYNIKVNAVNPGFIVSEKHAVVESTTAFAQQTVLGRGGDAAEFAEFVYRLAQMENVSGQCFNVENRIF